MSAAFAPHGWIIAQAAPFDDDNWPYKAYADIVDYTVLMAYDEADDQRRRAPSRARTGMSAFSTSACAELPADSTIIALGNYGYDWVKGEAQATVKEFSEAMVEARDSGADHPVRRRHQQSAFLL